MCAELPFLPGEEREKVKSTVRTMCEEQKAIMFRRGLLADANAPPPPCNVHFYYKSQATNNSQLAQFIRQW
ncbi:hypothetical protein KUF71_021191 [Frankliniella fusca]|uniref:Uncharacterized protein n=1 Tax=Frankliniella fusca TaxID=407009 RepID=A0AAE1L9J9_9NEOP|nr:hypothetical protein KUF71_021191 [Frankliniella fusca]